MNKKLQRFRAAFDRHGLRGAWQVARHGLRWRFRRFKNRRREPPIAPRMSAEKSIAAASAKLRGIASDGDEIAVPVIGPELSVGIVVPTFADGAYLSDALRSIRSQTFGNWHCYVIDDASPDDVDALVQEFVGDRRFTLLRHGANAGLAAARNTGIRSSSEDLLLFLDADDLLTPWSLETRVKEMRKHWYDDTVAGVHGQVVQCPEETEIADLATWRWVPASEPPCDWLSSAGESPFLVHAPLARSSVIKALGGFDEAFVNGAEDWDLWHRVMRHGYRLSHVRSVVGGYRQRRASMIRAHGAIHLNRANELIDASQMWVHVDPEIAVTNARMPIGDAQVGYNRLIRAARWAGIAVAESGSVAESLTDEIIGFLRPEITIGTRYDDCVRSAKAGITRGLGLSFQTLDQLDPDARAVIEALATKIADELTVHCKSPAASLSDELDLVRRSVPDVAVVADTAADVVALARARDELVAVGLDVAVVDTDYARGDEGAATAWRTRGVTMVPYNSLVLGKCRPHIVVARSPGHPVTLDLLTNASTWGGRGVFLAEADRDLQLPEAVSAQYEIETATVEQIAALVRERRVVEQTTTWRGSNFVALLPSEESPCDPTGSRWLHERRNSKRGETAVIIGNGPSLNHTDLTLLSCHDTFGVNSIFLADDRLPQPLTYYVVEDTAVFEDNMAAIKAYRADAKLFPTIYREHFTDDEIDDRTIFFRMNQGFYGRSAPGLGATKSLCHPRFSFNAADRLYCGQSVTIINLQLAYWLGYQRVVLIGMDFSYTIPDDAERSGNLIVSRSDDPNHFHPDYFGAGKTWKDPKLERVLVNYRLAGEIFAADGREIVNATVGGNLEVYPRMNLEQALLSR